MPTDLIENIKASQYFGKTNQQKKLLFFNNRIRNKDNFKEKKRDVTCFRREEIVGKAPEWALESWVHVVYKHPSYRWQESLPR